MTRATAGIQPAIHMIDIEAEALSNLAIQVEDRHPQVSELLLAEIGRATLHKADGIPDDVVTMGATVRFVDTASGRDRTCRLTYPHEADIAEGMISILTPIGAGLIGLKAGQSILWPDRQGEERELRIIEVRRSSAGQN